MADRETSVPSSRAKTLASASHSCGKWTATGHRTVVLAQRTVVLGGGEVAGRVEGVGEQLRGVGVRRDCPATQVVGLDVGQPLLGQPVDGVRASCVDQFA